MVRALDSSPFSSGSGEVVTQVASNSLVVARGGVGNSPRGLAQEDQQQQREGFLRALPFLFHDNESDVRSSPGKRISTRTSVMSGSAIKGNRNSSCGISALCPMAAVSQVSRIDV